MEKFERLERIMRTMKKERVITQDEILEKKDKERDFAKKLFGVKLQRNLQNHEKSTNIPTEPPTKRTRYAKSKRGTRHTRD